MIETNTPGIDTDGILARIREEVEQYNHMDFSPKHGGQVHFSPCPVFSVGESSAEPSLPLKDCYGLNELLGFHNAAFIDNAYAAILRREPDPQGKMNYLSRLRSGLLTKVDILGRLRYSREGRNKNVAVKGLLGSFMVHSLFKVPVLGWGVRLVTAVLTLPTILKTVQAIECAAHQEDENTVTTRKNMVELGDHVAIFQDEIRGLLAEKIELLDAKADKKEAADLLGQVQEHKREILDMQHRLQLLLEAAQKRVSEPISAADLQVFATEDDHLLDAMYVNFEERFRGSRQEIKDRIRVYLPHVQKSVDACGNLPVLDVGCGRGEWLEFLSENGIKAQGLDLNRVMVSQCRELGLDVIEADAIAFLRGLETGSLSVLSGFHIVEHLPFRTVIALFDEAFRVLAPGGMVVFETPNPENIMVGACTFYTDPTHERPIPPVTLSYLVEARGFSRVEILRLNLNPWIQIEDPFLNSQFAVGQDYSVMGFKS